MIVSVEVTIDAPIGRVFDLMADTRNEPHWNSRASSATLVSDPPIRQGSEFTTVNRGRTFRAVLTEYERPRHLGYDVTGEAMTIHASMDFTEQGEGTRMTGTFDFAGHGPMKVMLPVMAPLIRRDFPRQMASFKAFCEADAGAPDDSRAG
jgi:uncharacterized protein YndB with AHSA1/START domain